MAAMPGAFRTQKACASGFYIRITYGRERGAVVLGAYKAKTRAEAEQLERDDAADRALRYADARAGFADARTVAGIVERYIDSNEFKRCADSTQRSREQILRELLLDRVEGRGLGTMPTVALKSAKLIGSFERWRDAQAAQRGARAADQRVEYLRTAIYWGMKRGLAEKNPVAGLTKVWSTDRSELILEAQHVAKFLDWVKRQIDDVWANEPPCVTEVVNGKRYLKKRDGRPRLNTKRIAQITRLAAARDTVLLAINNGMRRENLALHTFAERQGSALAYTALKGARRAKTAGKKRRVTVVPVFEIPAMVYARRWEATGASSPWVITSARGAPYTPGALGELVNESLAAAGVERTLHDCKGTFVTTMRTMGFSNAEVAEMVDWSEDDVDAIARRYVSAPAIANAMIERMKRRKG
ncbi:hypothetical protein [Vitreimonas flagellata]|uniref:hypothetical protein n=1 Tax=Vitreimonas flagellata TaxID=2560861 RepID=UPI0010754367|nr:hypothetical protein [Vitreimonas flagellata]